MSQVAIKLYRQLHRVRRNYHQAQIPLVGIVGFNEPPTTDISSRLASAFRSGTVANVVPQDSDGFRALRQAQQQLQILKVCDEETREALSCWHQLCRAWSSMAHAKHQESPAVRLTAPRDPSPNIVRPGHDSVHETPAASPCRSSRHANVSSSAEGEGLGAGGAVRDTGYPAIGSDTGGISWPDVRATGLGGGAPRPGDLVLRLLGLSAALEEGALLVERLYDANHLSLEDFDDQEPQAGNVAAAEVEVAGNGSGAAATKPGFEAAADGKLGVGAGAGAAQRALCMATVVAARRQLDELAVAVTAAHPGLFPAVEQRKGCIGGDGGDSDGTVSAAATIMAAGGCSELKHAAGARGAVPVGIRLRHQLEAISQVLFYQYKFRHEPVEWVYDGLAPALLPQVLTRRRGIPLSLAVLYCSVARRLGVAAVPVKVSSDSRPSVDEGPAVLHGLPPDVATRQAGRTVALAPPLDCWLVAAAAPDPRDLRAAVRPTHAQCPPQQSAAAGSGEQQPGAAAAASQVQEHEQEQKEEEEELFVDVDRRGRVLSGMEARRRFGELPAGRLAALLPYSPVELWTELVRVMLTAHTRRGESDLVAYWLVQALALDHRSPEWRVLGAQ